MSQDPLRPAYMVYPGLYPMLMINYWLRRTQTPIVAILLSDFDIKHKGKNLSFFELVVGLTQECGFWYMAYMLFIAKFSVPVMNTWNFFRKVSGKNRKLKSFDEIAQEHGIPIFRSKDFNGPETQAFLKNVNANIVVSAYNNQILRPVMYKVPEYGTINIHPALLPNFRGLDGPFEAIYHKVPDAGVTIHCVDSRIDTGRIIKQKPVKIRQTDSLFSLSVRCWMMGAVLLEEVFDQVRQGTMKPYKQNPKDILYPYQSFPAKARLKEFHRSGKKLFTIEDLKGIFKD